jgi:glycosyltransferase involved in cell wall biosynthesis
MVRSVLHAGRQRGWNVEAIFSEVAHDRTWLEELRNEGFVCRLAPTGHRARAHVARQLATGAEPLILHTHFASFDMPAVAAARHRDNVIVYWHKHGGLRSNAQSRLRNTIKLGLLSRGVEEILCVAPNVLDDARACHAPHGRLALVPNAIDLARFQLASPEQKRNARNELNLPTETPVILHFGWDWARKGGDVFLQSVASLLQREATRNLVALTVADYDVVRAGAESLGIVDHVRALPPTDDVHTLYAAADLFVAPSRSEGHPFAVVEALASGLPVVASPIPGHQMIASSMQSCHIAECNHGAFADAAAETLIQPADDRAISAMDRAQFVGDMDIHPWSERMVERYEVALRRRSLL